MRVRYQRRNLKETSWKKKKKKAKQFPDQTKQFFSVKKITKNKTNKYICSNNDDNKEV